jgi:L-lactate dehydrogenase
MNDERRSKIGIVGAGSVGATIAYACMIRGVAKHISLFDVAKTKVDAEVLDLNHGLMFVPTATVDGADDLAILEDSDVIVVTAGAKQRADQSRIDLASANTEICKSLIPRLLAVAPHAILLMVTNPVDVLTFVAYKISGLPSTRVLGSGTVLDSSRFRFLIAQHCQVAVQNVHAYIAGEHGDSEIPLWSSATIANIPVGNFPVPAGGTMTDQQQIDIFEQVKSSAYQIIQGKGATKYALGVAVSQILEAILWDEARVLPVSCLVEGYHGITNVCLSVPRVVRRRGVDGVLPLPLNELEEAGLISSASAISSVIRELGF